MKTYLVCMISKVLLVFSGLKILTKHKLSMNTQAYRTAYSSTIQKQPKLPASLTLDHSSATFLHRLMVTGIHLSDV